MLVTRKFNISNYDLASAENFPVKLDKQIPSLGNIEYKGNYRKHKVVTNEE